VPEPHPAPARLRRRRRAAARAAPELLRLLRLALRGPLALAPRAAPEPAARARASGGNPHRARRVVRAGEARGRGAVPRAPSFVRAAVRPRVARDARGGGVRLGRTAGGSMAAGVATGGRRGAGQLSALAH